MTNGLYVRMRDFIIQPVSQMMHSVSTVMYHECIIVETSLKISCTISLLIFFQIGKVESYDLLCLCHPLLGCTASYI